MRVFPIFVAAALVPLLSGCIAIRAADAVGSAAVTVVSTAVDVTASVVGGAVDLVTGGDDDEDEEEDSD